MAARRHADIGFTALSVQGGLIAPTQIAAVTGKPPAAADYGAPKGTVLRDEISRYFRIGQAHWQAFSRIERPTAAQVAAFARGLLEEAFGFRDLAGPVTRRHDGRSFRLALEGLAGRVPIVAAAPIADADAFHKALPEFGDAETGQARRSPIALLQDWLNATDGAQWGLVFAGDRLRLMRDNDSLTRPAWIEADLGAIFRDEIFADFTALWLLIHASRFGAPGSPFAECPLERWREAGLQAGTAVRGKLRANVEEALAHLGQGFLDANPELRRRLEEGSLQLRPGAAAQNPSFFEQLLQLVYRLIFLAVAEDRELLHAERGTPEARLCAENYGFAYLRDRAARRSAHDRHPDAFEGMKIVLGALAHGEPLLGLPALGGLFAREGTPDLEGARIANKSFLAAIFRLSFMIEADGRRVRINWRDMATEELGSVYEGLLELVPVLDDHGRKFGFAKGAEERGNARKVSGSYYTPDALVQALLDSALNPVLDRAEAEGGADAILKLRVIDPACGSAHFLLGAARRMADRVARARDPDAPDTQEAMRDVVRLCIHGVDRNPMAVELAKVALWIETVSPGKPLGFLDANIRCGDSLLGVFDLDALGEGIPDDAYKPLTGDEKPTAAFFRKKNSDERKGQASLDFEAGGGSGLPPEKLARDDRGFRALPEGTLAEVEAKRKKFEARDAGWWADKVACDLYVAAFLAPKAGGVPKNAATATVPTTAAIRRKLAGGSIYGPLEGAAVEIAEAARAFHWPLMFPAAMAEGGFDVVLGNPPWERIKLQEQEFFAARAPEIAEAPNAAARGRLIAALEKAEPGTPARALWDEFQLARRIAEASSVFFTAPKEEDPTKGVTPGPGRRFPWTGRGDVNTYALFAELFLGLTREKGRAGIIVPTGIATDATTAPFFGYLVSGKRLVSLFSLENEEFVFPNVHHAYRFSLITLGWKTASAEFSFFLRQIHMLSDPRRRFTLSPADIERINPNTKTAPVFRSQADAALTAKIYGRVPVLIDESKGPAGNPWGVSFLAMFHMSNDSGAFRTAKQLADAGLVRDSADWVSAGAGPRQSALALVGGSDEGHFDLSTGAPATTQRWVPLYEAKMIHQFDHRWATYDGIESRDVTLSEKTDPRFEPTSRYWVPAREVDERLAARTWRRGWLMGWRDICRSTDERTVIAAIFPRSAVGHTSPLFFLNAPPPLWAAFLGNVSSLTLDFLARQKVGGTHLTYGYLNQLPILPPSFYTQADLDFVVPRVLELTYTSHSMAPFARDLGYDGPPFAWDEDRRAMLRAELDAWYALAYGLDRDELRYVLDPKDAMGADYPSETFRVLKNNEMRRFGEYRTARLVLSAYDGLVAERRRAGGRP